MRVCVALQGAPGPHLEIEVAPQASGRDLKRRVSRHLGVPCLYQALRAGGRAVEDEDALADHWLDRGAPLAVAVLSTCGAEALGLTGPEDALRRAGFRSAALLPEGGARAPVYRIREAGGARDSFTAKAICLSGMEQGARDSVLQEVALLRDLAPHSSLADCRRSFSDGGCCFLVTPVLEGCTLRAAIAEALSGCGAPCCTQAAAWTPQLLAGLAHLHGAGGVHRNLNPSSIVLQNGRQHAVLTDFGVSELLAEAASSRAAAYMSPELLRNEPHSPRDDMWALGCILYELCALVPPFEAPSLLDLAICIIEGDPDWSAWEGAAPLQATARRLLAKRPGDRPTASALLAEDAAVATAAARRRRPSQAWAEAALLAAPSPLLAPHEEATGGAAGPAGTDPGAAECCGGTAAEAKAPQEAAAAARPQLRGRPARQGTEPLVFVTDL